MIKFDFNNIQGVEMNPDIRKGDKIMVVQARNGQNYLIGYELDVVTGSKANSTTNITVKNPVNNSNVIVYRSGPNDDFILVTRENKITVLNYMKSEIERELDFITKYASEEEFVADKIDQLLKAKGVAAKADILRELKKTNYL